MGVKKIFQTLEDRNNPDEVESQGPFICTNNPGWEKDIISGILSWT